MLFVISLKDILLTYKSKQGDGVIQNIVNLFFRFLKNDRCLTLHDPHHITPFEKNKSYPFQSFLQIFINK